MSDPFSDIDMDDAKAVEYTVRRAGGETVLEVDEYDTLSDDERAFHRSFAQFVAPGDVHSDSPSDPFPVAPLYSDVFAAGETVDGVEAARRSASAFQEWGKSVGEIFEGVLESAMEDALAEAKGRVPVETEGFPVTDTADDALEVWLTDADGCVIGRTKSHLVHFTRPEETDTHDTCRNLWICSECGAEVTEETIDHVNKSRWSDSEFVVVCSECDTELLRMD